MKASIALQVLPYHRVDPGSYYRSGYLSYLQAQSVTMVVTPFETMLGRGG